jgi:hypothetical protein
MGFGHLPQSKRHLVVDGYCVRCDMPLPGEGIVCTKDEVGGRRGMILLGDLPEATPCKEAAS